MLKENAHDPNTIRQWFDTYNSIITSKGTLPTGIYNMDENGF